MDTHASAAASAAPGPGLTWGTPAARWVVAATAAGSALAMLDATTVNVALPTIADDLGATVGGLQWTVNGYTLTLASLILLAGSLADRFGRRRVFGVGVTWFAAASVACALAPTVRALVVARILQGVGGALLTPGSLAILQASFAPGDRGRAIEAWSGLGAVSSDRSSAGGSSTSRAGVGSSGSTCRSRRRSCGWRSGTSPRAGTPRRPDVST